MPAVQDRTWYERRIEGFGGSDAAPVLGISRWTSPRSVIEEKARRIIPDLDAPEPLRFRLGRELEPILLAHAGEMIAERTGRAPRLRTSSRLYRMPGHPFVTANVDGFADDDLVELKTDAWGFEPWGDEEDDWRRAVPPWYGVQVQHSLAATRRERGWLFVLIGLGEERLYAIPRDEAYITDLIDIERDAWDVVLACRARLAADPLAALDDLLPPLKGADLSAWVRKRYPKSNGLVLPSTPATDRLILELRGARTARRAAEAAEDEIQARLQAAMGEADGISSEHGTVTWKRGGPGSSTDWKDLYPRTREWFLATLRGQAREAVARMLDDLEAAHRKTTDNAGRFSVPRSWDKPVG